MSQKNRRFEPAGKKIKKKHSKRVVFLTMVSSGGLKEQKQPLLRLFL